MGPCVLIHFRNSLSDTQKSTLLRWLETITSRIDKGKNDLEFFLQDAKSIGLMEAELSHCVFGWYFTPFGKDWGGRSGDELYDFLEPDQVEAFDRGLGYLPEESIYLWAGCKDKTDHKTLGALSLCIAEKYHGVIDLGGYLVPYGNKDQFDAFATSMPGKIWEIEGHVVDVEFMKAWLKHPYFHMIK